MGGHGGFFFNKTIFNKKAIRFKYSTLKALECL